MGHKKKNRHRLYALTVIVLGIAIIMLSIIVFFYVQRIEVEGNSYTKDSEIIEIVQKDPASVNSLYIIGKSRLNKYNIPACYESMEIGLTAPWAVKVTVKEKPIVGYVYDDDGYVYFDRDGLVVCKGREIIENIPRLEGFDVQKATLYETLNSSDEKLFKAALALMEEIKVYELIPDRILCENGELYLYFGEVCVALGNTISTEKVAQVGPIIKNLEGESGTLHLEFYENENSTVTFNKGEYPGQENIKEEDTEEDLDEADDEYYDESYDESYDEYYDESYDEYYDESYDE